MVVILKNIKKIIKVLRNKNISKIIQRKIHKNKKEIHWSNKMKKLKRKIKRKKRNQNDLNNQIFKKKLNIIIILN